MQIRYSFFHQSNRDQFETHCHRIQSVYFSENYNNIAEIIKIKLQIFSYKSKFSVLREASLEAFKIPDMFLKLASALPSMHPSVQSQPKILHGPFPQNIPIISPLGFLPSPQTFAKHRSGRLIKKNENVQH